MLRITESNLNNDRQKEMTYILYMFMGSYFRKCECKSPTMARHLLLYYKEMPRRKQLNTEERVIGVIERVLKKKGIDLSDLRCEATITFDRKVYLIRFTTWVENVTITVEDNGKYHIDIRKEGEEGEEATA